MGILAVMHWEVHVLQAGQPVIHTQHFEEGLLCVVHIQ